MQDDSDSISNFSDSEFDLTATDIVLQVPFAPPVVQVPLAPTTATTTFSTTMTKAQLDQHCKNQGLTYSGGSKDVLVQSLELRKDELNDRIRRTQDGLVLFASDPGSIAAAWCLLFVPPLRMRITAESSPFTLVASGVEHFGPSRTHSIFATKVKLMIANAWSQLPREYRHFQRVCLVESASLRRQHFGIPPGIQGNYDCALLLIGVLVADKLAYGGRHDDVVESVDPLKISALFDLEATSAQKAAIKTTNDLSKAAAIRLIKKGNAVRRVESLREEGGLAIDNAALEILNIHDVCDAILMGLGWFQFARATFEASGNPI
ncbi:hypothetical protein BCR33DRAFT_734349 [Rhizoclosmatium globosum]|uniref:Uncharacterized protein n=1 Tax=Rhizoclosmatium globosum TaxID=329046 RepID=A0A1Y2CTI1_9FUNG|nr:hypothetical protein BCR33DRAFT_742713 [Rhizoclosmatium globosum]ORY50370.1 hypothetical protein BCR33DRAFT_734349 [Rhizoclosmatium globosum]|eukprot:ORY36443.1 hypothetical protein BCR33DRAFT_742713 [Rhizoclosmatium globosum]